jgi:hypothetical protein
MSMSLRPGAFAAVAVTVVIGLAACGQQPGVGEAGPGPDGGRLEQQAKQALERWDAAVAARGDKAAFVPVGELTDQVGSWEEASGSNNKLALMTGNVVDRAGLSESSPDPGQIRWLDGKTREVPVISAAQALRALRQSAGMQDCQGCQPLEITEARLSTRDIATSRGKATVPVWEFMVRGSAVRITRVAVDPAAAVTVTPPSWDPYNAPGGLAIESASTVMGSRELKVNFTGSPATADKPCGVDYTATAIESANAVVIIIHSKAHAANEACTGIGAARTAVATLAAPLGERAVLEVQQGMPIPVMLER